MGEAVGNEGLTSLVRDLFDDPQGIETCLGSKNPGEGMISNEDWRELGEYFRLSSRELRVAVLIFEGNSRSQIAQRMAKAPGTVRSYIDRIFAKLNVADRLGMVLRIMRIHLALVAQQRNSEFSH